VVTSDHVIKMTVTPFDPSWKPHAVCQLSGSIFYRTGAIDSKSFTLQEQRFLHFYAPVTLTLIPWPSHTSLIHIPLRCTSRRKMFQGLQNLSCNMHADIPTYSFQNYYYSTSQIVTIPASSAWLSLSAAHNQLTKNEGTKHLTKP